MGASWVTFVSALGGIVAGGLVTYVTSRSQLRVQAEHTYDRALRDLRLTHYQTLFHLTRPILGEWALTETPRCSDLLDFRKRFHDWYFGEQAGGMFLSQAARRAYFSLQNELQTAAGQMTDEREPVSEGDSILIRGKASSLRHQLTADLGTAEPPRQGWIVPLSLSLPFRPPSRADSVAQGSDGDGAN